MENYYEKESNEKDYGNAQENKINVSDNKEIDNSETPISQGSGSFRQVPSGLSGRAAFLVMAVSSLTVGGIIALLALQIWIVEGKYERNQLSDWGLGACQYEGCAQEARLFTIESEAQSLRTDRIRTAQLSRLFVFVVAEVAGFTLLVMGAVLVFDRVIARQQDSITASQNWSARSEFPGILMCFLGSVIVIWTVQSANKTAGFFEVFDRPVFISDPNWYRNQIGLPSGSRPNNNPQDISSTPSESDVELNANQLSQARARQAPVAVPPTRPNEGIGSNSPPESTSNQPEPSQSSDPASTSQD